MEEETLTPPAEETPAESAPQVFAYDTAQPPADYGVPGSNPASPLAAG
jgi:hypothetical protein